MALVAVLVAGCGGGSPPESVEPSLPPPDLGVDSGPVVEVVPATALLPPLDPNADPRTPLGELRARYLPIWSQDFDWAFPPEVCGSDWALDAIAETTSRAQLDVLGDVEAAAALSVMRYEHLLSGALAYPDALAQLCVAVATVGSARADALDLLASHLVSDTRNAEPATYPDEVRIVALSPSAALAVACVAPGYSGIVTAEGTVLDDELAGVRLQAYLLATTRGLEDSVPDISYRVSDINHRPADSCGDLDDWEAEWDRQVRDWVAEGEIWGRVGRTVGVSQLCGSPPADGPDECPEDWSS